VQMRNLICVILSDAQCVHEALLDLDPLSAGWSVHTAKDVDEAIRKIEQMSLHVGVLSFSPQLSAVTSSSAFRLLCTKSGMRWIALLRPEYLEDNGFRATIVNYFHDYHTLPIDRLRFLNTLGHADGMALIEESRHQRSTSQFGVGEFVYKSTAMQRIDRTISKVALVDSPVLITGESGTGKELAALNIHRRSTRSHGPFVAINCGALPATLIQSELFGYERGAFTGATKSNIGRIEAATGGVLFLDEIGELPLDLQVNLLRVLQEGYVERLGSSRKINVDLRVIAATNVDVRKAVANGSLRADLYYRLNVLQVTLPALRERTDDIELLARFFFSKYHADIHPTAIGFCDHALEVMKIYSWPGNVRELINRIYRAMVMCETRLITTEDLGLQNPIDKISPTTLNDARAAAEKRAIQRSLQFASNNVSEAARALGISRGTLYKLMSKHEVDVRAALHSGDTRSAVVRNPIEGVAEV